jgi:hypothetical protein
MEGAGEGVGDGVKAGTGRFLGGTQRRGCCPYQKKTATSESILAPVVRDNRIGFFVGSKHAY